MVETAAILNQAGARSLVILDEIGRGTATFDGLSIAWATIEHLHDVNKCRALFATHFHELTALAARLERLHNATVRVKEWQGEVVFLHEVTAGAADRSYGIQVAKLAGLPARVIERAKIVLAKLEAEDRAGAEGLRGPAAVRRAAASRAADRGRRLCLDARRAGRAQSRRDVAARGDGSALPAQRAGGQVARSPLARGRADLMMNIAERTQRGGAGSGASLARPLRRRRCRAMTRPRPPSCSCRTGCGATCSPSPGPSKPSPGARPSSAKCAQTLARTQPRDFHIPQKRTPPRWVTRAGTECIEAIVAFDTAFGPCNGVLRLVPDGEGRLRAWTLNTNLHELRGHEEAFKRRARARIRRATSAPRTGPTGWRASAPSPTAIRPCW